MLEIEKVDFAVEASDNERFYLWKKFHKKCQWSDYPDVAKFFKIGELDNRPICLCLDWFVINEKKVLFYFASSEVVDYKLVEKWIKENALNPKAVCVNAANFRNIFDKIEK